jgi:xanthine dehydrogenase small subunit
VRHGPKRPPLAVGLRADGTGIVRVARTEGSAGLAPLRAAVREACAGVQVEELEVPGPPVAPDLRAAGWAEVLAARHALAGAASPRPAGTGRADVTVPGGGRACVALDLPAGGRGRAEIEVWAGAVLCPVTLRSYALGALHQALGLVWSEGIAVDDDGVPLDLTIRSFGILAARDMPEVSVRLHDQESWPVNGSDAVFVATLAAAWVAEGLPDRWPTRRAAVRAPLRDVAPSVAAQVGREEQT